MQTQAEAQETRTRRAFINATGKHSIEAASATERMIATAKLAGITIARGDIALVRQFFANVGAVIDRASGAAEG